MREALFYLVFAVGVVLPMIPGLVELVARRDDSALAIDERYSRDPRYLGKSFREKARPLSNKAAAGVRMRFLERKREFARVVDAFDLPEREHMEDVLLARGPVSVGKDSELLDLYAEAGARIGANAQMRALAVDGDAVIGEGISVARWIDVEGNLTVGRHGNLGMSASAAQSLIVDTDVRFRRLFGHPVLVGSPASGAAPPADPPGERVAMIASGDREHAIAKHEVAANEAVEGDIISGESVRLGPNATVEGCIKSDEDVVIGTGARVFGNVVARGSIAIGRGGAIFGHVFAEGRVTVAPGAVVGTAELPKTVYGGKRVELAAGSCVYGWAITEGDGSTVVADA